MTMTRREKFVAMIPLFIIGAALFIAAGGWLVHELWNWLGPALFGLKQITFWQAVGLLALCRILFGGLGMRGSNGSWRHRRLMQRVDEMTPEERERFRQAMRDRWGVSAPGGDGGSV